MLKAVGALLLLMVGCAAVLVFGLAHDYRALSRARSEVPPTGSLSSAFQSLPLRGGHNVETIPLLNPTQAWLARWHLLAEAREQVDVAYFILDDDIFGLSFLGALLDAADRGVRVRILVDGLATNMADMTHTILGKNFLNALSSHSLIEVRVYGSLWTRIMGFIRNPRVTELIANQHDKIINVDGEWVLTGGRNIAQQYFTSPEHAGHQFIDADILLRSPAASQSIRSAFERTYDSADASKEIALPLGRRAIVDRARQWMDAWLHGKTLPLSSNAELLKLEHRWRDALADRPDYYNALSAIELPKRHSAQVRVVDSPARDAPTEAEITHSLSRLIEASKRDVTLINPYLVLNESLVATMVRAAGRGVSITVLTNSPLSSDNAVSQAFFLDQWPTLIARVSTLRLFVVGGEDTLHSKVMLFDGELSLVGTYNLDPTAMQMSSELMVGLWSESLNAYFRADVARWLSAGEPKVYQYDVVRSSNGKPLLSADGLPRVQFGPEHHVSPLDMVRAERYRTIHRWVRRVLRLEPFIRNAKEPPAASNAP